MATFNSSGNKLTDGTNNITLAGNLATSGAFGVTLVSTATTSVTLPTSGTLSTGNLPTTEVTGTSQAMSVNNSYIASNAALVTLSLPATSEVGDVVMVIGKGAGGWKISQAAGQSIQFTAGGSVTSTTSGTGGYVASVVASDTVEVRCLTANTLWEVVDAMGNITYV